MLLIGLNILCCVEGAADFIIAENYRIFEFFLNFYFRVPRIQSVTGMCIHFFPFDFLLMMTLVRIETSINSLCSIITSLHCFVVLCSLWLPQFASN